jgi:hypothetical protein
MSRERDKQEYRIQSGIRLMITDYRLMIDECRALTPTHLPASGERESFLSAWGRGISSPLEGKGLR